ncbi:MAG: DUF1007 family protein [bacterium]
MLTAIIAPVSMAAHPHMWIDATIDLQLGDAGLRTVTVTWLFDQFNSADMILSFDENRDGRLSEREQRSVREDAFTHLVDSDYFLLAYRDSDPIEIHEAESFRAGIVDGRLFYEFSVPLNVPWQGMDTLVLAAFDESYFIDFVSEPMRERYEFRGRTLHVESRSLEHTSQGWGTIRVPALRMELQ